MMSARDLQRIEVLTDVLAGRRTVASAATVLDLSMRLVLRYRDDGAGGLIHKGRVRSSNHRANEGIPEYALELVRTLYRDIRPTLAIEALYEKHGIKVGREILRTWMHKERLKDQ